MALPIIFNLPRRRQRPQTEGGGGSDKHGEGNQKGGGEDGKDDKKKKKKRKITQASRAAATKKGSGDARRPIRSVLLSAGSGASPPTSNDVLSVFSLNGLGYTRGSVCLSFMPFYFHSVDNKVSVSAPRFSRLIRKTLTSQRKWHSRRKQTGREKKTGRRIKKNK